MEKCGIIPLLTIPASKKVWKSHRIHIKFTKRNIGLGGALAGATHKAICKIIKYKKNMHITITLKNGKTIRGILTGISKTHIEINSGEFVPISMLKHKLSL